jgi:hypothetical protein
LIMNTTIQKFTLFFTTCLLACSIGHAYEQDNWYLANEWDVNNANGICYDYNSSTNEGTIFVSSIDDKILVYDTNGTLKQTITGIYRVRDVALDDEKNLYAAEEQRVSAFDKNGNLLWRLGKNASSGNGSQGTGNGEFRYNFGIEVGPNGNIYVADKNNQRVQIIDKNGNFIRIIGSSGSAPGQFQNPQDISFLKGGTLLVSDDNYISFFDTNGTFTKRTNSGRISLSVALDETILSNQKLVNRDGNLLQSFTSIASNARTVFTPEGDLIVSPHNGHKIQIWKRSYRTKGLPVRNIIPQPVMRAITQRAGTNIIDLDFEILDPDDANATVGILAAQDGAFSDTSKWILPQTWVDGTGSKIGTPIATNQVHRVSWNVKPDWPDSTGTLKFEIICHDARRTAPVDLHFLTLPLPDGNLTISRSPLKDSDFLSYGKFLLTTGQAQFESNVSKVVVIPKVETNATQIYTFTNAGATGRNGPTPEQLIVEYNGTNLQGSVSAGFQPGYQKWTVPATGTYVIEAVGARGGSQPSKNPGLGAFMRGDFNLTVGQELTILVGQMGIDTFTSSSGAGGGGGTFVVADSNNTPLIVAGGGSGAGGDEHGSDASTNTSGFNGSGSPSTGGTNGSGGQGQNGGAGGGFLGSGTGYQNLGGKSYQLGGTGGEGNKNGGFGGGGAKRYDYDWENHSGGGGGYSGGGGSGGSSGDDEGGGGGSYNSGSNQLNSSSFGDGHGYVRIFLTEGINPGRPKIILINSSLSGSQHPLLEALGTGYRYATPEEVQKASEAATAGGVNRWTANRPIQPRNLPNKVNEYGFDTGDHGERAWWVVQE